MMEKVSINFGPLQDYMKDDSISEVMVNRFNKIFIEKTGKIQSTNTSFASEKALNDLIIELSRFGGRELDQNKPYFDTFLPDGSRANAALPPMVPDGACLTIRKFRKSPFSLSDYIKHKSISEKAAFFLHACVIARVNIVVCGGTGTGKTSFLNSLCALIPQSQRIISIEDTAELNLQHPNWVRMESVYNARGNSISTKDCLVNALRMRPDRIIVGECRKDETFEMLQALNTGHEGSMTTIHANNPRDCLTRIESLILSSGTTDIPIHPLRKQISSAIQIIVHLKRTKTGDRLVSEIVQVTGMEQTNITTQILFTRERNKGLGADSASQSAQPELISSGLVPTFMEKFAESGVQFPPHFFDPTSKVTYQPD